MNNNAISTLDINYNSAGNIPLNSCHAKALWLLSKESI